MHWGPCVTWTLCPLFKAICAWDPFPFCLHHQCSHLSWIIPTSVQTRACSFTSVTSNSSTPWTAARQAPLSRQAYWSCYALLQGISPPPPPPGSEPKSLMSLALAGGIFTTTATYVQTHHSLIPPNKISIKSLLLPLHPFTIKTKESLFLLSLISLFSFSSHCTLNGFQPLTLHHNCFWQGHQLPVN